MEVLEISRKKKDNVDKMAAKELMEQHREKDSKMVKGMFEFIDAQGGWLEFTYRWYPGEPIYKLKLTHGERCELPLGIIRHLNNTKKKIRKMNPNLDPNSRGVPTTYEVQSRVRFTTLDVL